MTVEFSKWSKEYWRKLNPQLTLEGKNNSVAPSAISETQLEDVSRSLAEDGYFNLQNILDVSSISRLRSGVERLHADGLAPAYIYVYDEAWHIFASLHKILTRFLGEAPALLPNFWAWFIEPKEGSRGWPPHQDCEAETSFRLLDDEYIFMSLSFWIPLSEATLNNGCMFVLPRREAQILQNYDMNEIQETPILNDKIRALPAKPGDVMGWAQDIYHWSGVVDKYAATPRISLSLEFQNSGFEPLGEPLLSADRIVSFEERVRLIDLQFNKYRHMEEDG